VLKERYSQPLPGVKDSLANDPVPGLLCRRALEAALLLLSLYNKAADDRILIDGQGLLERKFLRPVRIDLASYLTGRLY
jgi:deoxyinosine 3'endonuclease (endonuclease V)